MRAYRSVLRLQLVSGLQYRTAALAGLATQFFWGFLLLMVFQAFYSQSAEPPPMSPSQLAAYVWLQQAFLAFIALWIRNNELFALITSGNIAYELCRPIGLYAYWYAKLLAQRLAAAALRCLPILAAASLLPEPYRLAPPPGAASALLFAAALLLGALVLVAVSMLIHLSVFVTMSPAGSMLMFTVVGEFCAGMVVPIPLMPGSLQDVVRTLPFHLSADFPFRVYSGHIPAAEAWQGLALQGLWLAGLAGAGRLAMTKALNRAVIQGG